CPSPRHPLLPRPPLTPPHSSPTRRSSDLPAAERHPRHAQDREAAGGARRPDRHPADDVRGALLRPPPGGRRAGGDLPGAREGARSEEHTSELQSLRHLVCRLLLEKKNKK